MMIDYPIVVESAGDGIDDKREYELVRHTSAVAAYHRHWTYLDYDTNENESLIFTF